MDDTVQKSCWGVTVWTVAVFSALLVLGFLFAGAGAETVTVAAG